MLDDFIEISALFETEYGGGGFTRKAEKDIIPAHIFKEEKKLTWLMLKGKLKYINIFGSVFEQKAIQIE